MLEAIQAWLNSKRPYRVGVMLYLEHGQNNLFKKALATEGESRYKLDRIVKELTALNMVEGTALAKPPVQNARLAQPAKQPVRQADPPPVISGVKKKETAAQRYIPKSWPRADCRDDYEAMLWEKAMLLLKEIASLHAKLSECFSDYERRTVAFNLLRKDDALDDLYELRDHYRTTKSKKEDVPVEYVTDPFMMAQRLDNLKRYLRREKLHLQTLGDTTERRERIEAYRIEYNFYAEKMGKPFKDA
jgi:hypothetical protein